MGKDGKKGLGMGLGALFGEEYPTAQPEREETAPDLLPIEKIEPRADQPRKRFDPEALELLGEQLQRLGVKAHLRPHPADHGAAARQRLLSDHRGRAPLARQPHGRTEGGAGAHPHGG